MHIKTGIDIIEVERIKSNIEKFANNFLDRIFTEKEIAYCESKNVQKYESYAARFAAKEAVLKAFSGTLESKFDVQWKDIEVLNDQNGRPFIILHNNIKSAMGNSYEIDISLSHVKEMAIASVVAKLEVN